MASPDQPDPNGPPDPQTRQWHHSAASAFAAQSQSQPPQGYQEAQPSLYAQPVAPPQNGLQYHRPSSEWQDTPMEDQPPASQSMYPPPDAPSSRPVYPPPDAPSSQPVYPPPDAPSRGIGLYRPALVPRPLPAAHQSYPLPPAWQTAFQEAPHAFQQPDSLPQGGSPYYQYGQDHQYAASQAAPLSQFQHQMPSHASQEREGDNAVEVGGDTLLASQKQALGSLKDSFRSYAKARDLRNMPALPSGEAPESSQPQPRVIKRRGPRKAAEPTGDVKMRLNNATAAYLDQDYDRALAYVEDAIRINGEIHSAWKLLASILDERGQAKESLLARVCAAHLEPKVIGGWTECAKLAGDLLIDSPDDFEDVSKIAIMANSQAIRIEPDNIEHRLKRAALYLARESYTLAISDYQFILERQPFDLDAIQGFVEAAVPLSASRRKGSGVPQVLANEAFRRAIHHYLEQYPAGRACMSSPFTWDHATTYIELLFHLKSYSEALEQTRALSRWILGRKDETFWDTLDDDREWDGPDERRYDVPGFVPGKYAPDTYGRSLPLRLRAKLAICRLRVGHYEEAMVRESHPGIFVFTRANAIQRHLEWLDPTQSPPAESESQWPELLAEVASALFDARKYAAALRFYEPLRGDPDALDASQLYQAGRCYLDAGDNRQAEECFTAALDSEDPNLDARIAARYELAKMYEKARQKEEAYILVNEAMELERDRDANAENSGDEEEESGGEDDRKTPAKAKAKRKPATVRKPRQPKEKKAPKLAPRIPREPKKYAPRRPRPRIFALDEDRLREENERSAYLAQKWEVVRHGRNEGERAVEGPGEEWLAAARELVNDFCSFKAFFPWERYLVHIGLRQDKGGSSSTNPMLLKMAQRLKDNMDPTAQADVEKRVHQTTVGYRDVSFPDWLDLFLEYALALAHTGSIKEAYEICDSAKDANVFFEVPENLFLIHVASAACALRARDEERCIEVARWFMAKNQFATDGFRLYAALCRLCASTAGWYADSRVQKFTLRQIKLMDAALLAPDAKQKPLEVVDPSVYPSRQLDVTLLMLYGHILFVSNSFTYALNYFVRAYAVDPDNLMVNLSIGLAYLHYAMKRQAENRQYLLAQGFAFLHRWYRLRLASADAAGCSARRQEAHYNLARCYHALGLTHLAAEYYRRVFREAEDRPAGAADDDAGDLVREAAYNLQNCCVIGGDTPALQAIAEKWLVL